MTPAIKVEDCGSTHQFRPNCIKNEILFTDDFPHGLFLMLGLGELVGFDLERNMSEMLAAFRSLQRWMGKGCVLESKQSN